jgi:hypothetical protein
MNLSRYEYITQEATRTYSSWTYKEKALFHQTNRWGLKARRRATDDRIRELVDAGHVKSGALLAYGSLNFYHTDKLSAMAHDAKSVKRIDFECLCESLLYEIAEAKKFIAGVEARIQAEEAAIQAELKKEDDEAAKAHEAAEAEKALHRARYRQDLEALQNYVTDLTEFLKALPEAGKEHDGHRFRLMECVDALREAGQINE